MSLKFIGLIAAVSIAVTSIGASPARADEEDVARALAAILGVAVIAKVIKDRKDDREVSRRRPGVVEPRPLPRRVDRGKRKLLPQRCFRNFDSRRGVYRGFGERCLHRHFRYANRLPESCLIRVRGNRGPRFAYEARCMRNHGYRLARH